MAEDRYTYRINFKADLDTKGFEKLAEILSQTGAQSDKTNRKLEKLGKGSNLDDFFEIAEKSQKGLANLSEQATKTDASIDRISFSNSKAIVESLNQISKSLSTVQEAAKVTDTALGSMGKKGSGVSSIKKSVESLGKSIIGVGKNLSQFDERFTRLSNRKGSFEQMSKGLKSVDDALVNVTKQTSQFNETVSKINSKPFSQLRNDIGTTSKSFNSLVESAEKLQGEMKETKAPLITKISTESKSAQSSVRSLNRELKRTIDLSERANIGMGGGYTSTGGGTPSQTGQPVQNNVDPQFPRSSDRSRALAGHVGRHSGGSRAQYGYPYISNPLMGALGFFGLNSVKETVVDTGVQNETNKLLLEKMGAQYDIFDEVTNKTLTSIQDLIPAMNAMYTSANLTANQVNDTADTMATFGSYVKILTGSEALSRSSMYYLSRAYQGEYRSVDQYGITDESLKNTGLYKGAHSGDSYDNFMAAVDAVMGDQMDKLMNTTQGQISTTYKGFTRAGKQLSSFLLPPLKNALSVWNKMNDALGNVPAQLALLGTAGMSAASVLVNFYNETMFTVDTMSDMVDRFRSFRNGGEFFSNQYKSDPIVNAIKESGVAESTEHLSRDMDSLATSTQEARTGIGGLFTGLRDNLTKLKEDPIGLANDTRKKVGLDSVYYNEDEYKVQKEVDTNRARARMNNNIADANIPFTDTTFGERFNMEHMEEPETVNPEGTPYNSAKPNVDYRYWNQYREPRKHPRKGHTPADPYQEMVAPPSFPDYVGEIPEEKPEEKPKKKSKPQSVPTNSTLELPVSTVKFPYLKRLTVQAETVRLMEGRRRDTNYTPLGEDKNVPKGRPSEREKSAPKKETVTPKSDKTFSPVNWNSLSSDYYGDYSSQTRPLSEANSTTSMKRGTGSFTSSDEQTSLSDWGVDTSTSSEEEEEVEPEKKKGKKKKKKTKPEEDVHQQSLDEIFEKSSVKDKTTSTPEKKEKQASLEEVTPKVEEPEEVVTAPLSEVSSPTKGLNRPHKSLRKGKKRGSRKSRRTKRKHRSFNEQKLGDLSSKSEEPLNRPNRSLRTDKTRAPKKQRRPLKEEFSVSEESKPEPLSEAEPQSLEPLNRPRRALRTNKTKGRKKQRRPLKTDIFAEENKPEPLSEAEPESLEPLNRPRRTLRTNKTRKRKQQRRPLRTDIFAEENKPEPLSEAEPESLEPLNRPRRTLRTNKTKRRKKQRRPLKTDIFAEDNLEENRIEPLSEAEPESLEPLNHPRKTLRTNKTKKRKSLRKPLEEIIPPEKPPKRSAPPEEPPEEKKIAPLSEAEPESLEPLNHPHKSLRKNKIRARKKLRKPLEETVFSDEDNNIPLSETTAYKRREAQQKQMEDPYTQMIAPPEYERPKTVLDEDDRTYEERFKQSDFYSRASDRFKDTGKKVGGRFEGVKENISERTQPYREKISEKASPIAGAASEMGFDRLGKDVKTAGSNMFGKGSDRAQGMGNGRKLFTDKTAGTMTMGGGAATMGGMGMSMLGGAIGGDLGNTLDQFGSIVSILGIIATLVGTIGPLIVEWGGALSTFIGGLTGVTSILGALGGVFSTVFGVLTAFAPELLVIVGAIALIKHYWENITGTITRLFNFLKGIISEVLLKPLMPVMEAIDNIVSAFSGLFGGGDGGGGLVGLGESIISALQPVGTAFMWIAKIVGGVLGVAFKGLAVVLNVVAGAISAVAKVIHGGFSLIKKAFDIVTKPIQLLADGIQALWDKVGFLIKPILKFLGVGGDEEEEETPTKDYNNDGQPDEKGAFASGMEEQIDKFENPEKYAEKDKDTQSFKEQTTGEEDTNSMALSNVDTDDLESVGADTSELPSAEDTASLSESLSEDTGEQLSNVETEVDNATEETGEEETTEEETTPTEDLSSLEDIDTTSTVDTNGEVVDPDKPTVLSVLEQIYTLLSDTLGGLAPSEGEDERSLALSEASEHLGLEPEEILGTSEEDQKSEDMFSTLPFDESMTPEEKAEALQQSDLYNSAEEMHLLPQQPEQPEEEKERPPAPVESPMMPEQASFSEQLRQKMLDFRGAIADKSPDFIKESPLGEKAFDDNLFNQNFDRLVELGEKVEGGMPSNLKENPLVQQLLDSEKRKQIIPEAEQRVEEGKEKLSNTPLSRVISKFSEDKQEEKELPPPPKQEVQPQEELTKEVNVNNDHQERMERNLQKKALSLSDSQMEEIYKKANPNEYPPDSEMYDQIREGIREGNIPDEIRRGLGEESRPPQPTGHVADTTYSPPPVEYPDSPRDGLFDKSVPHNPRGEQPDTKKGSKTPKGEGGAPITNYITVNVDSVDSKDRIDELVEELTKALTFENIRAGRSVGMNYYS